MESKYQKSKIYKLVSDSSDLVYYGSTICKLTTRLAKHRNDYKRFINGKRKYKISSFELIKVEDAQIILVENYPCNNIEELRARERFYIENNDCVNKCIPNRTRKEYIKDNQDEITKYKTEYYQDNKEVINKKHKEYYQDNKEKVLETQKKWRINNTDKKAETDRIYRENNKQKIRERDKLYYENNKQKLIDKSKEWYQNNKDKKKEYDKKRNENNKDAKKLYDKERYEANKTKIIETDRLYKEEILRKKKGKIICDCGLETSKSHLARHKKTAKHKKLLGSLIIR